VRKWLALAFTGYSGQVVRSAWLIWSYGNSSYFPLLQLGNLLEAVEKRDVGATNGNDIWPRMRVCLRTRCNQFGNKVSYRTSVFVRPRAGSSHREKGEEQCDYPLKLVHFFCNLRAKKEKSILHVLTLSSTVRRLNRTFLVTQFTSVRLNVHFAVRNNWKWMGFTCRQKVKETI